MMNMIKAVFALSIAAIACTKTVEGPHVINSNVPVGKCQINSFYYVDIFYGYSLGPEFQGNFPITVTAESDSISEFNSDSLELGMAVAYRPYPNTNNNAPQYYGIISPGFYRGLIRFFSVNNVNWIFEKDSTHLDPGWIGSNPWKVQGRQYQADWGDTLRTYWKLTSTMICQ